MNFKRNKTLLIFLMITSVFSVKSQTVKNATHYFFYEKYNDFQSDSLLVNESIDLSNYNESVQKYYLIEFNNSLNHTIEILIYKNDTVGILTGYFYEVNEVKVTKEEKKSINGRKIKKYNYQIWSDTSLIDKGSLRKMIESIDKANLNASLERNTNGYLICEGKRNFNISVKSKKEIISFGINEACLKRFDLNDNLIPVIYLLIDYTNGHNLYNKELPINQMFKIDPNENYACIRLKKGITTCKAIY